MFGVVKERGEAFHVSTKVTGEVAVGFRGHCPSLQSPVDRTCTTKQKRNRMP
jgi:hypothetical protein